jgi:hypothetical protein
LEFPDYSSTQAFLDRSSVISEETGIFPNLSFGRTYVNFTLFADETSGELTQELLGFADRLEALVDGKETGGEE